MSTRFPRRHFLFAFPVVLGQSAMADIVSAPVPTSGDDTKRLQQLISGMGPGGVLDGHGQTYVVTKLLLKSDLTLQNFNFRAKGTQTPLDSVLTIDGNANPVRDVVIRNVHIDGNRAAQTNLVSEEDGGRDGIRIVGRAERILITGSSAVNCATDGLKIFSHRSLSHNDASLNFKNIYINNCRFLKNRRHGASGDSLENVHFVDCEFSDNGTDLPGDKSEGARGAIDNGTIYGAGVDIEGYGSGCGVNGLYFTRCKGYRNARFAFQFWEPTSTMAAGFLPRKRIVFDSCSVDGGVSPHHGHQAIELSQPVNVRAAQPTYTDVTFINLQCKGTVILSGAHNVTFAGGRVVSPYAGFWGILNKCRNVATLDIETDGKILARKD